MFAPLSRNPFDSPRWTSRLLPRSLTLLFYWTAIIILATVILSPSTKARGGSKPFFFLFSTSRFFVRKKKKRKKHKRVTWNFCICQNLFPQPARGMIQQNRISRNLWKTGNWLICLHKQALLWNKSKLNVKFTGSKITRHPIHDISQSRMCQQAWFIDSKRKWKGFFFFQVFSREFYFIAIVF